ncbi:MAG: hypothetical protein WC748_04275 [Legionellales bacterium]|jgi:hypothetical protein
MNNQNKSKDVEQGKVEIELFENPNFSGASNNNNNNNLDNINVEDEADENEDTSNASSQNTNGQPTVAPQVQAAPKPWSWGSLFNGWGMEREVPATTLQQYGGLIGEAITSSTALILNYAIFSSFGSNVFLLSNNNTTLGVAGRAAKLYFDNSYLQTCIEQLKKDIIFLDAYAGRKKEKKILPENEEKQMTELKKLVADIIVVAGEESRWNLRNVSFELLLTTVYAVRCSLYFAQQADVHQNNDNNTCPKNSESVGLMGLDITMTILAGLQSLWTSRRESQTAILLFNVCHRIGEMRTEREKAIAATKDRIDKDRLLAQQQSAATGSASTSFNESSPIIAAENNIIIEPRDERLAEARVNKLIANSMKNPAKSRERINSELVIVREQIASASESVRKRAGTFNN